MPTQTKSGGGSSNPFASGGVTSGTVPKSNGSGQLVDSSFAETGTNAERIGAAPNAAPAVASLTLGEDARPGTDTNVGGSSGTIIVGDGTGTGTLSKFNIKTPTLGASGTGAQTLLTRNVINHVNTALVNNTATLFVRASSPASALVGLVVRYVVEVKDATNTQVESGIVSFAVAVTSGGVMTLGTPTKTSTQAVTSGTLTVTFTSVTAGSSVDNKITSNSSLTPTTHRVAFEILNLAFQAGDIALF